MVIDPSRTGRAAPGPPGGGSIVGGGLELPGDQVVAPTYNKFRPPPGFAQEDNSTKWSELDSQLKQMDPNQLMDMLSARAGYWHTLAKIIPILNRAGFDGKLLEDITGIDSRTQNLWMMSASVYDSLKLSSEMSQEEVKYFDNMDQGPSMLSEFRFVGEDALRIPAAKFIAANKYGVEMSEKLARAVKDYERRTEEERAGFEYTPADCLCLKLYRDAVEESKANEWMAKRSIEAALGIPSISETARARVERLAQGDWQTAAQDAVDEQADLGPPLETLRFTDEEIGFRPIGVAGTYGEADAAKVMSVTTTSMDSQFGFFQETGAGHAWMTMPMWRAVAFAKQPFVLYVPETSSVAPLSSGNAKGSEGPAVILVDKVFKEVSADKWYILPGMPGPVELVAGRDVKQRASEVLGQVVTTAWAPKKNISTSDLPFKV